MRLIRKQNGRSSRILGTAVSVRALALAIGKSQPLVSMWFHGRRTPSVDDVVKMAGVLEVAPAVLEQRLKTARRSRIYGTRGRRL